MESHVNGHFSQTSISSSVLKQLYLEGCVYMAPTPCVTVWLQLTCLSSSLRVNRRQKKTEPGGECKKKGERVVKDRGADCSKNGDVKIGPSIGDALPWEATVKNVTNKSSTPHLAIKRNKQTNKYREQNSKKKKIAYDFLFGHIEFIMGLVRIRVKPLGS